MKKIILSVTVNAGNLMIEGVLKGDEVVFKKDDLMKVLDSAALFESIEGGGIEFILKEES